MLNSKDILHVLIGYEVDKCTVSAYSKSSWGTALLSLQVVFSVLYLKDHHRLNLVPIDVSTEPGYLKFSVKYKAKLKIYEREHTVTKGR